MRLEVVSGGGYNVRREADPFRTGLLSAPFLRDLAEIMVLIDFKGGQSTDFLEVSDWPASLTNPARFEKQCGLRQQNSPDLDGRHGSGRCDID